MGVSTALSARFVAGLTEAVQTRIRSCGVMVVITLWRVCG